MDLRGKYPIDTFPYLVTTDGNQLFTGTGSLITSLIVSQITSSFVTQSYATESFIHAVHIDTENITASVGIYADPDLNVYGSNNDPHIRLVGNPNIGGKTFTLEVSPANASLSTNASFISVGNDLQISSHNILSNNDASTFFGTSSAASTGTSPFNVDTIQPLNLLSSVEVDVKNALLVNGAGDGTVNWGTRGLYDNTGQRTVDWQADQLLDENNNLVLDWKSTGHRLYGVADTASFMNRFGLIYNTPVVYDATAGGDIIGFARHPSLGVSFFYEDTGSNITYLMRTIGSQSVWFGIQSFTSASIGYLTGSAIGTSMIRGANGNAAFDVVNRTLHNKTSQIEVDLQNQQLLRNGGIGVVDWLNMWLVDSTGQISVDWTTRHLIDASGSSALDWQNGGVASVRLYGTADTASYLPAATASYINFRTTTNPGVDPDSTVFSQDGALMITASGGNITLGNGIVEPEHGIILYGDGRLTDVSQVGNRVAYWNATPALTSSLTSTDSQGNILTASYSTGSPPPSNTSTPVAWIPVVVNGVSFKMPLYQ